MVSLLLVLALCHLGHSSVHILRSANDLIAFSRSVNNGADYSGATVLLGNDIDFSGGHSDRFDQIGKREDTPFLGEFDGQGYTISNLVMRTTSSFFTVFGWRIFQYTGLFGYSDGAVIKNIVIGPSCSFTNAYNLLDYKLYTGGVIGMCSSRAKPCVITNNVNMADISFKGETELNVFIGGIVGYLHFRNYPNLLMNCVNYGPIAHYGRSGQWTEIGGIIGMSNWESVKTSRILNCLNYGSLIDKGSSLLSAVGGIAGISLLTYVDNCVNLGRIVSNGRYIGAIVGKVYSNDVISHCYWAEDIKYGLVGNPPQGNKFSKNYVFDPNTFILKTFGWNKKFLIKELNSVVDSNPSLGYSPWVFNNDSLIVSFTNKGRKIGPTTSSKVILLPKTANRGDLFLSLCKNPKCEKRFSMCVDDIKKTGIIDALWMFKKYTVTFDLGNGITTRSTFGFNETIVFPIVSGRKGYKFGGWDKKITRMPAEDIEIKVVWIRNGPGKVGDEDDKDMSIRTRQTNIKILSVALCAIIPLAIFLWFEEENKKPANQQATVNNSNTKTTKGENAKIIKPSPLSTVDVTGRLRAVVTSDKDDQGTITTGKALSKLDNLYPSGYAKPSMKEALTKAGLSKAQANSVVDACNSLAKTLREEGEKLFEGFTEEDAAAVAMYTYDFGSNEFESNPYRIVNKSLVGRNYAALQKASGLLYLVMAALRKLPRTTGRTLYRGVRNEVNLDEDHYYEGNVIAWTALSSTSPDMNAVKDFLANGSSTGNASGTLFIIEGAWGYNVQPYSLFPDEEEILLELCRQFKVVSVIKSELTIIKLHMLDTPLCLSKVFDKKSVNSKKKQNLNKLE